MFSEFTDKIPLWGVLCMTIFIVWAAIEAGFWSGARLGKKPGFDNEVQITAITGAHLALLAFIFAFTFGMAASHYDDRKGVILDEANAIETAYLRTFLVADPQGEKIRALLRQYTGLRARASDPDKILDILSGSTLLQSQIWDEIEALAEGDQFTVKHSLLVQSINEMFDLHQQRVFVGVGNRIPQTIWIALYAILLFSMIGMGFHSGIKGARSPIPSAALALSFSIVLFLIADLDRPRSGILRADQSMIVELSERLEQSGK